LESEKSPDHQTPFAEAWQRIESNPSFETVKRSIQRLRKYAESAEFIEALAVLGLDKEDPFGGEASTYGRSSMQQVSAEVALRRLIELADSVEAAEYSRRSVTELTDAVLDIAAEHSGSSEGEHYTPTQLAYLMAEILNPSGECSIYDPGMGTGGLLTSLRRRCINNNSASEEPDLYGQEINQRVAAIANINLRLQGANIDFKVGDTLVTPRHVDGSSVMSFDYVAANPPLRIRLGAGHQEKLRDDPYDRFEPESIGKTADIAFVQHVAASLGKNGRGIIVVSPSLLQGSGRERNGLESLLEADSIEAVVRLPGGMLNYTNSPISLLILNRGKTGDQRGKIMMVEVDELEGGDALSHSQRQRILASVNHHSEIDGFSTLVTVDQVVENKCAAGPARYVTLANSDKLLGGLGERRHLGDIATVHRGNKISRSNDGGRVFVMAGDIAGDTVHKEGLSSMTQPNTDRRLTVCKPGDILLKSTEPFDASIAGETLADVPINQHVIIIRLKDEFKDLQQLLVEFIGSDTGHRLLAGFASGITIPRLRVDQVSQLPVPIPGSAFLKLIEDLHRVEADLESRRERLSELRNQLFDMKDTQGTEAHVRELSSDVQVISDSLVQTDDLAYRIRNFYPFPVAWGYRSLQTEQEETSVREELKLVAENLLAFLACVGLALLHEENVIADSDEGLSRKALQRRFRSGMTFGDWQKTAFESAKLLRLHGTSDLASEYSSIWFAGTSGHKTSGFYHLTKKLVEMRNTDSHGRGATLVERRNRAQKLQEKVDAAYDTVSFLVKYPMHLVTDIDQPFGQNNFEVTSLAYVGDHPHMQEQETTVSYPVTKRILYIEASSDRWVPLHPWITASYCTECKSRETFIVDQADVEAGRYRFRGFENGHSLHDEETRSVVTRQLQNILSTV
jgi:type I restriction-modification system DNA methylase subunit